MNEGALGSARAEDMADAAWHAIHNTADVSRLTLDASRPTLDASRLTFDAIRSTQYAICPTLDAPRLMADGALLLVTLIWGSSFVIVKDAVVAYPVFSFIALRFIFAALALLPLVWWRRRREWGTGRAVGWGHGSRRFLGTAIRRAAAPLLVGSALFAGFAFQTAGLHLTTPAKAGFITGLSVVIVPVVAALLLRRGQAPGRNAWIGVGLATLGLALLSLRGGLHVELGDLLVFCCALAFAVHILLTGHFAPRYDPLLLTFGQVLVVAALSAGVSGALEVRPPLTVPVVLAAAFTGLLATSVAFGVQTLAQRFTSATHTALIFAAEPVFAALFSLLLIGELLGPRQLAGCGLILAGMVVSELRLGANSEI